MPVPLQPLSRRDVLKLISLGAGAWFLVACGEGEAASPLAPAAPSTQEEPALSAHATSTPPAPTPEASSAYQPDLDLDLEGLERPPEDYQAGRITPTESFYVQNSNGIAKPDPLKWRSSLDGLFENPLELSLPELKSRARQELMRTLECIGNPAGGSLIGNATWTGISLAALLAEARPAPEARYLIFYAADEYSTAIPLSLGMQPGSTLVYEMNGEPLPAKHGSPLRVLLPGVYGQKQPKWVLSIRASARDSQGTWEKKGWSNEATIQINSRIETPSLRQILPAGSPFYLTGAAMADTSGVAKVEVSLDDGKTWQTATLSPGPDAGVWTLWHWVWEDPRPGKYVLLARATDGRGATQEASSTFGVLDGVFPNGTRLMHRVSVTVM